MLDSARRRLRLVLRRPGSGAPSHAARLDETGPFAGALPEVEFLGYAEDCLFSGHVRLDADRLSDLLNRHDQYDLVDVLVHDLASGHAFEVREVTVERHELLLVHAAAPRGRSERRRRTRQHPVALQVGPYRVRGYLHALPGSDPIVGFRRRPMVPLTDAWIDYESGGSPQRRRVGTVVVNREQVDWIAEADDELVELPDLPLEAASGGLAKDFTGQLLGDGKQQGG